MLFFNLYFTYLRIHKDTKLNSFYVPYSSFKVIEASNFNSIQN